MRKYYSLLVLLLSSSVMFGQLIINEVLYDPSNTALEGDANGDGSYDQEEDSFIEFVNTGSTDFDMGGYEIWDDLTLGELRYTIPAGTMVPANSALVVFGGGTPTGSFGGAIVLTAESGGSTVGMNLNNSGEVIVIKDANGATALTFDSDALSNNPNESYTRNPDLTGNFEQHADNTPLLFSPGTTVDGGAFGSTAQVTAIAVQGANGETEITVEGGTLQMEATVTPTNAADPTVAWSVPANNGVASIDASGLLTAIGMGTVEVTATANDGSGVTGSTDITVSYIAGIASLYDHSISIYPNPATDRLYLPETMVVQQVMLYNIQGQLLEAAVPHGNAVDVSALNSGNYFLKIISNEQAAVVQFIKD